MAVFYNTGGGDIYGGPDRDSVVAAMLADWSDIDVKEVTEVLGSTKVGIENEDGSRSRTFSTLAEEYDPALGSYCISTENL